MRVLITGHRGFIGRHLRAECYMRGYSVIGIDTDAGPMSQDCRHFFRTDEDDRFDLAFHCAATVGGRETIDGDPLGVATNLSLDAEMFNWAMRTKPGRVVYFSSSAAYPIDLQDDWATCRPLAERDIRGGALNIGRPDQTYGWAKLTGEMLASLVNASGVPVHVFRPFSGYGTDQDSVYPFRAFLDRARARKNPFEIWGDGMQTRDFIHVDDIVAAVFAAIEQDVRGPVNLCTGVSTTFTALAEMICGTVGYKPAITYLRDKPVGVQYRVGDPLRQLAFYRPRISLLEGIRLALGEKVAA